jgi:hypothetical protein
LNSTILRPHELEALLPFANESQAVFVRAIIEHGSQRLAAEALGTNQSNVSQTIARVLRSATARGFSPLHDMTRPVPEGYTVKGVSTLYDADGKPKAQWVKSRINDEQLAESQKLFVSELVAQAYAKPKKTVVKKPAKCERGLMVGYPIGDHHFGMFAHAPETGADYDLKIAKQLLADSIDYLVETAPPARVGLLASLGDLFHVDNRKNQTPKSGYILDVDSRYHKIIAVGAYGLAHGVERLLQKHEEVWLETVPGNHDPDSTSWLSLVLEAYFRNEPRVKVGRSPAAFKFWRFGKNMGMLYHGDTIKIGEVSGIMAAYEPAMWGESTYRVAWGGHVHHAQELRAKEHRAVKVETFGVLPPSDAHGAAHGYKAYREMHGIVFKESGGEQGRITFNV